MSDQKLTAKDLLRALRLKYKDAAILAEVTLEDEEEAHRQRTFEVLHGRYRNSSKKWYDKKGLSYNAELPEGYHPDQVSTTMRRIDALMVDGQVLTAIEVKISRADFFRDTDAKRAPWRRHTNRFVYLVPAGLVKPEEIPTGCGLWEYELGQIMVKKRAVIEKNPVPFPPSMMRYFIWRAFAAEKYSRRGV